jgi:cellulose synthase/poly-beta-1,6-N-acetylglucosamine synthase-like glycosyltransferase
MLFLFWISLFAIFYAYVGYPLFLLLISRFWKREDSNVFSDELPRVSLLISAYNEEKVIGDKIENSLALNYPGELLEIVVISDSSTDRTEEIVKQYSDQGVILRSYQGRIGKTACLNKAVPLAKGDIVVFSDANSRYDKNAINELVRHFEDEQIGFVSGTTKYVSGDGSNALSPINMYSKLEALVKRLESKISSCVGADGAIFAIRKKLFQTLDNADINDLVIPLEIVKQGYKGILEEKAFCIENSANGQKGEFKRQERISNRTIRAIFRNQDMLNPMKFGMFAFELFSHKLTKFFVPYFLIILLVTNILLAGRGPIYDLLLGAQLMFYFLAFLGIKRMFSGSLSKLISFCHTFVTTNLAILYGWISYFKGKTYTTWVSSRG